MEKVFEVFILYMGMVASFGHVTKFIWSNMTFLTQHDPVSILT